MAGMVGCEVSPRQETLSEKKLRELSSSIAAVSSNIDGLNAELSLFVELSSLNTADKSLPAPIPCGTRQDPERTGSRLTEALSIMIASVEQLEKKVLSIRESLR